MLGCGHRGAGRMAGVRFAGIEMELMEDNSFSIDLTSFSGSLARTGVAGRGNLSFSGDPLGVEFAESRDASIIKLRSRTLPGWRDCIRLWGLVRWTSPRSGEKSVFRLWRTGTSAFSRAFSVNAACADWIANDVPLRDVPTLGDCGLRGSGGGARSGSELSHL